MSTDHATLRKAKRRIDAVSGDRFLPIVVEVGTSVEVRWDVFSSTSLTADQLSLEDDED